MANPAIKVFISQPMSNRSEEEVKEVFENAKKEAYRLLVEQNIVVENSIYEQPVEYLTTYYDIDPKELGKHLHSKVYTLGNAFNKLCDASYIYFAGDWQNKRGCVMEYICAQLYCIPILNQADISNRTRTLQRKISPVFYFPD